MTKLQHLNRHMLALEKAGRLTEAEYATYRTLLDAVEVLAMSRKVRQGGVAAEYADMVDAKTLAVLEKLK